MYRPRRIYFGAAGDSLYNIRNMQHGAHRTGCGPTVQIS